MAKIIVVCEKPSAAKHAQAALLSGKRVGKVGADDVEVISLLGHLYELEAPEEQVSDAKKGQYHSWDLQYLPWNPNDIAWKMKPRPKVSSVIKEAKAACKGADEIVCATDDDPGTHEGTGLFCEFIIQNNIKAPKFSRMYFADESVKAMSKAYQQRVDIPSIANFGEWKCAWLRERWDWMSMQWTRIATNVAPKRAVLRQGRLKSAMVYLVGEQLDKVKAYKKIPYYQNRFKDENGIVYTNPNEPTFPDKSQVPRTYSQAHVVVDSKTDKSTPPPRLMDIAALSARLAPQGVPAKTVLATYQKMYEAQVVSYPRTEDKKITDEQFDELLPKVDSIAALVGVDAKHLTHRTYRTTHVGQGMAHGANRPGPNVPSSLDALDNQYGQGARKIYELLARNYLAMLAEDYLYEHQKGHLQEYPDFKGQANVPKSQGWKAIFTDEDEHDDDLSDKGLGTIAAPFIFEGFPPKPSNPTWNWLRKQLEKRNVGTGATRTSIYADVTNARTKYPLLVDKRGRISMTEFGEMSYRLLPDTHIGDLTITEQLFSDMKKVEEGKMEPEVVLGAIAAMVEDDIKVMKANASNLKGKVGSDMVDEDERFTGSWNGTDVRIKRVWRGHRFTDEEVEKLLAGETLELYNLVSKKGGTYASSARIGHDSFKNSKGEEVSYIGIIGDFLEVIPAEFCKHKFTDDERTMLEKGQRVRIEDFVSKKGSTFGAYIKWGEDPEREGHKKLIMEFE